MYPGFRRGVALAFVLAVALVAPAARAGAAPSTTTKPTTTTKPPNPTTTTPTPTTSPAPKPGDVPPPPPFTLPLDYGLKLLAQREAASKSLLSHRAALPGHEEEAKAAQAKWNVLQARLEKLEARVRETERDLEIAHENLRQSAVEAYINAGSSRLETAIAAIARAGSALDASRTLHLIGSFSDQQDQLIEEYEALKVKLVAEREEVAEQRREADVMLAAAKERVAADKTAIAHAQVRLTAMVVDLEEFEKAATSASSPILGPSILTASQLAGFIRDSGYHPRLTVPLDELAALYITEGENAGVRGDVAFAQSILETGGFSFPGGGQVLVNDNNFAGIGACDSCPHGFHFETAEIGVRAQMQSLRIYVDPDMTETTLKQPLVMPKQLNLGFRGRVQTWWDLWGTWATGAFYGQRVYEIYERMLEYGKAHPPPPPPLEPLAPPAVEPKP
jgi:hypothetical protein